MRPLFAFVAAVLLVAAGPAALAAQEATPVAEEGLPAGVSFEPLALEVVERLPPAPAEVGFVRVAFAPGTRFDIDPEPSLALIVVESGRFTFSVTTEVRVRRVEIAGTPVAAEVAAAGVAFDVGPGEAAFFPPFATGEVRNDGPEPVVALALFIGPAEEGAATPAATPVAAGTPVVEEEEVPGLAFQPLAFGVAETLPAGPALIGIGRLTLAPGAAIPPHPHPGPEFGVVEAGTASFTVSEGRVQVVRGLGTMTTPAAEPEEETVGPGQEATLAAGDAMFVQPGTVVDLRNEGDAPLVILGGLVEPLPAEDGAATPAAATPAP